MGAQQAHAKRGERKRCRERADRERTVAGRVAGPGHRLDSPKRTRRRPTTVRRKESNWGYRWGYFASHRTINCVMLVRYVMAVGPSSATIPPMISPFAGWFSDERASIVLVASDEDSLGKATERLVRIGLDNLAGGYVGVVPAAAQGRGLERIPMVGSDIVEQRLRDNDEDWTLLDVRDANERAKAAIEGSQHIYVGELNSRWKEFDPDRHCIDVRQWNARYRGRRVAGQQALHPPRHPWEHGRQRIRDRLIPPDVLRGAVKAGAITVRKASPIGRAFARRAGARQNGRGTSPIRVRRDRRE